MTYKLTAFESVSLSLWLHSHPTLSSLDIIHFAAMRTQQWVVNPLREVSAELCQLKLGELSRPRCSILIDLQERIAALN